MSNSRSPAKYGMNIGRSDYLRMGSCTNNSLINKICGRMMTGFFVVVARQ
jgi:hypothetical protein